VAWGPIKTADLKIAGERAASLPIQIVGDPTFPAVPARCSSIGPSFRIPGINGVLGIGVFRPDCGSGCAASNAAAVYYRCPTTGCQPASTPVVQQVQNPIAFFSVDNNGAIVQLPAIPATGTSSVSGVLVFGIGTRPNNALAGATVLPVNPSTGHLTAVYNNQPYPASIIDSGSNVLFLPDNSIPVCTSASFAQYFCPASSLSKTATIQGTNGATANVNFTVGNAETLFGSNRTGIAFNDLAAQQVIPNGIDFGLPFFYGRNIYVAMEGASTPAGPGPFFAF
jgi:hypothetical protein